jgi:NADPH-dependent ferric siderophore reductase
MNRHPRGPSTHVLIAADEHDLRVVTELVAALPADAYGQLLLETPIDAGRPEIVAPERVAIQWLPRAATAQPGRRLADSLTGWAREWLVDQDHELHDCHHLFIGGAGLRPVDVVREVLFVDECRHVESLDDIVVTRPAPGAVRS